MINPPDRNNVKKGKNTLVRIVILIFCIGFLGFGVLYLLGNSKQTIENKNSSSSVTIIEITDAWNVKDFTLCRDKASIFIEKHPFNFQALLMRGFSNFYLGDNQDSMEVKSSILKNAIADLRINLVLEPYRNNSDIFYILGKSYFGLGYYYSDLSYLYLLKAKNAGYQGSDLLEYLGVVSSNLGNEKLAISYFEAAMKTENKDAIHLALVYSYLSLQEYINAQKHIDEILKSEKDPVITQKARFIKADILTRNEKTEEALAEYLTIIKSDPNSADGHYYVGEMHFLKSDLVKARAEWRAAVNIDPKHSGAINRLNAGM